MNPAAGLTAGPRHSFGLLVLALPCLLIGVDATVLFLAMPQIAADLRPTLSHTLWIVDIYGCRPRSGERPRAAVSRTRCHRCSSTPSSTTCRREGSSSTSGNDVHIMSSGSEAFPEMHAATKSSTVRAAGLGRLRRALERA